MRLSALATATAVGFAPFAAAAQEPPRLDVTETVAVAAPPDAVWERIGQFDDMSSWHPAVAATEAQAGNAVGTVRVLSLGAADGPTITEELTDYSQADRSYFPTGSPRWR